LSLIISGFELELLKKQFGIPEELLLYLPFMEKPIDEEAQRNSPGFSERNHFVTVGTFKHEPNFQSVLYLKQVIWKLIRKKLPEAELHIYGAHLTQKVEQLHHPNEGFLIKGYVEDIKETLQQYRVCLAPLPFGAGLKGKLIDAMKSGTPCVMSSMASEGMFGALPANGFIEDDAVLFSEKAVEIFTIEKTYSEYQNNGFQIINRLYDKFYFNKLLLDTILGLQEVLEQHRQKNFIGSMLQHHTMQSYKYMSKWIEAKNN
ncbi:MAG: glycosyltransferase, partial [Mangrovimonas sp.]|nr:glycosyltransferase [Mangrovimonas sp.]